MRKKLVVTGALGHIGSALIHKLQPEEFSEVLLIDDMSAQRYCSLFNLPNGVPFRFIEADVCSADLNSLFAGASVVVHLAAITDANSSFDKKDLVERVNFTATKRVAEACITVGASLIFPSTTSVYGVQANEVNESCGIEDLQPQSPYAEAKLKSEQWLAQCPDLRYVTLRLGTIFGASPGMRFHTAVNKFIWQACAGQPLTVWRTAMDQLRPYLSVGDAVAALRHTWQQDLFDRTIYNVVSANSTVAQIVDIIRTSISDVQLNLVDSPIMNQLSYHVANRRFSGTGFAFSGDLGKEITESVTLLRNIRQADRIGTSGAST